MDYCLQVIACQQDINFNYPETIVQNQHHFHYYPTDYKKLILNEFGRGLECYFSNVGDVL